MEVYDLLEFFAGCGALTDEARCSGYRTASVDIKYVPGGAMDCNAPAGFAFLVTLFLQDVLRGCILTALDLGCMWLQYFVPALMHQLWHGLAYYAPRGLQHLVALFSELG